MQRASVQVCDWCNQRTRRGCCNPLLPARQAPATFPGAPHHPTSLPSLSLSLTRTQSPPLPLSPFRCSTHRCWDWSRQTALQSPRPWEVRLESAPSSVHHLRLRLRSPHLTTCNTPPRPFASEHGTRIQPPFRARRSFLTQSPFRTRPGSRSDALGVQGEDLVAPHRLWFVSPQGGRVIPPSTPSALSLASTLNNHAWRHWRRRC